MSGIADAASLIQAGTGIADSIYNIWSGDRAFKAQQKQQNYMNESYENATQIRSRDMQAAGIHPTLAVGQPATVAASAGSPPMPHINTQGSGAFMQKRLFDLQEELIRSQANKNNAEADATSAISSESRREKWAADISDVQNRAVLTGTQQNRLERETEQLFNDKNPIWYKLQMAGLTRAQADASIRKMEEKYITSHEGEYSMPVRNPDIQELEHILRELGVSSPQAASKGAQLWLRALSTLIKAVLH